jgi:hypothetical protein
MASPPAASAKMIGRRHADQFGRDFDGNGVIVGATDSPAPSTLVASGLVNFGTVNLRGSSSSNVGTLQVNGNASSYATLNINTNSKLGVTGSLTQYNGATVVNGQIVAGAVNIAGGQINLATTVTGAVSQSGGMIEGTGSISGNMTETGGIILGGTVADGYNYRFGFYNPGSPGTLTINGNFVENGANVVEMLRQPQVTPLASKIAVSGSVTLMGGALQIDDVGGIDNGIPLAAGQTYTIMTFASLSGTFANVQDGAYIGIGSSVNIGGGLTLNVVYNASSIQLQVAATSHTGVDAFAPTVQNNNEPGGVPNGSYDWSNASNWSGGIPGASTTAVIDDTITNSGSLVTVPGRGYRLIGLKSSVPATVGNLDSRLGSVLPDKPSIAVLPFQSMSADPEQEYFADGVVEEIITALSRFSGTV